MLLQYVSNSHTRVQNGKYLHILRNFIGGEQLCVLEHESMKKKKKKKKQQQKKQQKKQNIFIVIRK